MKRKWYEISLKYYTFPFFMLPLYPIAWIREKIIEKKEKRGWQNNPFVIKYNYKRKEREENKMAVVSVNGSIVGVVDLKEFSIQYLEENGIRVEKVL